MSQTLLTSSVIAREMLMRFKNQLQFTKQIDRQYSDKFAVSGAKIGDTISVRKPPRFTVTDGAVINIQNVVEEKVDLTLNKRKHVAFQFTSQDLTLTIDDYSKRYLDGAVAALANQVDMDLLQLAAQATYNAVGTPGTTPSAALTYLQAHQKINESAGPRDGKRTFHINPAAEPVIVDGLKGLFQSSNRIAEQYESGMMGQGLGGDWYMAQNVYSHTVGQQGGSPQVDGPSQTGAALSTKGWTSSAANRLKKGDVFTIEGVHKVNPITFQSTGQLQQFVVTADFDSDGGGDGDISISPSIVTSGSTQTVDASPADSANITVVGSASATCVNNILTHKNAFTLGTADLEKPQGVDFAAVVRDEESGISMRIARAWDVNNDTFPCRIDILYGSAAFRPEWATRIMG